MNADELLIFYIVLTAFLLLTNLLSILAYISTKRNSKQLAEMYNQTTIADVKKKLKVAERILNIAEPGSYHYLKAQSQIRSLKEVLSHLVKTNNNFC